MRGDARRAIVIGGSIAGLAAGLMLRRIGFRVLVFERASDDQRSRGAGIVTHPRLFAMLETLGIPASAVAGVAFDRRIMLDGAGRITHQLPYPQTGTTWASVYAALLEAFGPDDYRADAEFKDCAETSDGIVARFADGTEVEADVLVGADGIRSSVRRKLFPETSPLYAGYVTWRGIVPSNASPARRHPELFDDFCFCLPEGEQIAGYPVSDGHGGRACNFIWYRPADPAKLDLFLTDETGRRHPLGIPPPLVRNEFIEAMRRDAASCLAPQFSDLIESIERPFFQAIYDLECPAMAKGRAALVGDAAFVARPHVGAGVTKALEDVSALVEALATETRTVPALKRFHAQRHPAGRGYIAMARKLGAYMQAERRTAQEVRDATFYRDPAAVLSDHASLRFLDRRGSPAHYVAVQR